MRLAASLTVGTAAFGLAATGLGLAAGVFSAPVAWASLAVGAMVSALPVPTWRHEPWLTIPRGPWQWGMSAVFAFAVWRSFFFLVFTSGTAIKVQSANNLGDLPKHMNYIRHLAGGAFWPDNPLLAGGGIHYPFGSDLLNTALLLAGAGLERPLIWVGLLAMFCLHQTLLRWAGALGLAGLLFAGGLAGFAIFSGTGLRDFQGAVAWKNLFLSMVVTQRGLLFALPAGLLLLCSWRERLRPGGAPTTRPLPRWVEVLLLVAMPLFHGHSVLFLVGLAGSWLCFGPAGKRKEIARSLLPALPPMVGLFWLVTDGFSGAGAVRWAPGWMRTEENVFWFWTVNFGISLPLGTWLVWSTRRDAEARAWVWPCALLFLACCFFGFAPWLWDNTKLMIWAWLGILPVLGTTLAGWHPAWRSAVLIALFFSGAVSLFGGLRAPAVTIANRQELDEARHLLAKLPRETRLATAPVHDHPAYLLGRKMAMAYNGHLLGHGLPYAAPTRDLDTLMNGREGWGQAARRLGATHVFWGERETALYPESTRPWAYGETLWKRVPKAALYKIEAL